MEEDIKIIKDVIYTDDNQRMAYIDICNVNDNECENFIKAIENLININKQLKKQLNDIHENFCKFNWQESNEKQVYNQLADLYESIYRK